MRRSPFIVLCFVLALVAAPLRVVAVPVEPPEPVGRSVGRVPTSAEVVVVVDGLAGAREQPAFRGFLDTLGDLGLVADLRPHAAGLAALLGWSDAETFDRLLGSRVIFVSADSEPAKKPAWVLLSDISGATDQRIKEKIPLAPRKAVEGLPIFALERGEYEMATVRVRAPDAAPGAERVLLLLGPAGRATLFDLMAKALNRGAGDTLAGTPVVRELAAHTTPGVLVALRIDRSNPDAGPAARPWDDFLVCTATPNGRAWDCRMAIRDAELADRVRRVEPTSDAPYRAMSGNAILAVLETRLAGPDAEPGTPFEQFLSLFTVPVGSEDVLSGRQAIAVWPPRETKAAGKHANPGPSLCCAFALETTDVEKLAVLGDRHLGSLVAQIERVSGGPGLPVPDFRGVSPQAVRTVALDVPASAPVRKLFRGSPQVAWSYPQACTTDTGARRGWWQVCVTGDQHDTDDEGCGRGGGPCATASRQMVAALLEPPAGGETDRWVSIGAIRPSDWAPLVRVVMNGAVKVQAGSEAAPTDIVRVFERIHLVEWRLAARDNDDIAGTLRIEMVVGREPAP